MSNVIPKYVDNQKHSPIYSAFPNADGFDGLVEIEDLFKENVNSFCMSLLEFGIKYDGIKYKGIKYDGVSEADYNKALKMFEKII